MATGTNEGPAGADTGRARCSVCGKEFLPKFKYQLQRRDGELVAFCSNRCQLKAMASSDEVACSACGRAFIPEYSYQTALFDGRRLRFCSIECREAGAAKPEPIRRLAVYNLKGGTGKTTTAVSLAAAVAKLGFRVLLVDADPQGSVSVSLGVKARRGLYQILVLGTAPKGCVVEARENLDVIYSDQSLGAAEIFLAGRSERYRVMHDRLSLVEGYDLMIIDCCPSLGLLTQNALRCADSLLVPTSCDYLGVVGLQQALQVTQNIEKKTGHKVKLVGVLPTFHDGRLRGCRDAMKTLHKHWGGSILPPIRVNSKLREAPAYKKTIFEHARRSSGAGDYGSLAEWIVRQQLLRTLKGGHEAGSARRLGQSSPSDSEAPPPIDEAS